MHTVILDGDDLNTFKSYMSQGLRGDAGTVSAVQVYVQDDGRLVFGTNGYNTPAMGRPNAPLSQAVTYGSPEEALEQANVAEAQEVADMANQRTGESEGYSPAHEQSALERRVVRLERFAEDVSSQYDLTLPAL